MTLTFIDSGVLIAASRGVGDVARRAAEVLDDPERSFASSDFVRLEVLPKPVYYRRHAEAAFYEAFFQAITRWADVESTVRQAYDESRAQGLAAMDALHVAAATIVGADELVTTEKPGRQIHRTRSVPVRTLYPTDQPGLL